MYGFRLLNISWIYSFSPFPLSFFMNKSPLALNASGPLASSFTLLWSILRMFRHLSVFDRAVLSLDYSPSLAPLPCQFLRTFLGLRLNITSARGPSPYPSDLGMSPYPVYVIDHIARHIL